MTEAAAIAPRLSKATDYISKACMAAQVLVYALAWGIKLTADYWQHSAPPFKPCLDLYATGQLFFLFMIAGCGLCGFLFMCSSANENRKNRCTCWAIAQLGGAQLLALPVSNFFNWGHGAEATLLFYGGASAITSISLILAIALSSQFRNLPLRKIFRLRLLCLLLLLTGMVLTMGSIEKI